jgi:hypothetical protein
MSAGARRRWSAVIQFLVIGYSALGRSFAYLGLAPAKLFVGEIFLGWFMTVHYRAVQRVIGWAGRTRVTALLRLAMGIFLAHGLLCILHGFLLRRPAMPTLMNFAFNYYALYLVIGLATAMGGEHLMPRLTRRLAWIHGLYGVAYVGGLHSLYYPVPGSDVNIFAQPTASAFCVLALLQYEPKLSRAWFPILLNLAIMGAVQVRAEWLGFIAAFALWSVLAGKVRRLLLASVAVLTLIVIGLIFDVRLPGLSGRGGEISVQGIVGRALAPIDPYYAEKYVEGAADLGGTVDWRTRWWKSIWSSVNEEGEIEFFFGHGYGFEMTSLAINVEEGVRTPHSVFFYALGYGGWLGALVFIFFQTAIAAALWKVYRLTGDAFGLAFWVLNLALGLFGNSFETPFGAIPFYLVTGIVLAPLFQLHYLPWTRTQQRPAVPMPPLARGQRLPWAVDHA